MGKKIITSFAQKFPYLNNGVSFQVFFLYKNQDRLLLP